MNVGAVSEIHPLADIALTKSDRWICQAGHGLIHTAETLSENLLEGQASQQTRKEK
jgi:hypothetical protein